MKLTHKHHIIPKHMGGTDDPSNIIELTVEGHAEAHRNLFEEYGNWQDYAAWQGLSVECPKKKSSDIILVKRIREKHYHQNTLKYLEKKVKN